MLKVREKKLYSQHETCSVNSTGFKFASLSLGLTEKVHVKVFSKSNLVFTKIE